MGITERIGLLRQEMAKEKIDVYIVPSADYHDSEYVGDFFKVREYMTGFSGSAGTAVFTQDKAGLWTDGRYFLQAEKQLEGSGITLYKSGEPGTDTVEEFLEKELPFQGTLGFDGRTVRCSDGEAYAKIAHGRSGRVSYSADLVGRIWKGRPPLPKGKLFPLDMKYSGESSSSKFARLRGKMSARDVDLHVLSSLDDIAWLLNLRGSDIDFCPLFLSYMIIDRQGARLFIDPGKISGDLEKDLEHQGIVICPYEEIYVEAGKIPEEKSVLLDPSRTNYALFHSIPEGVTVIRAENPTVLMKSVKNDTEAENFRRAHLKDGIAHTRFMYWLKTNIGKMPMTELSVSDKLEGFRSEQEGYLGASFAPICAFGDHGAVIHYSATEDTNTELEKGGLFLSDTGGHYWEGSTDVTRTVALGEVGREEKEHFTLVARAMLRLAYTTFLHGCSGANLDCIAREVFWKEGMNFNHGTGHGVGYLMNIHEAPVNFRWKEGQTPAPPLEKNMVLSDEPGIYIEGFHGIRLENLLLVQEAGKNEYGQFMKFEILTYVPIDLDALIPERMTEEEREMLNDYHRKVYARIAPHLNEEERTWLRRYTRSV